jgi:DNA replication protein
LLPSIDNLGELKLILFFFWRLDRMEGAFRFLRRLDFTQDEQFMGWFGDTPSQAETALEDCLEHTIRRGVLLKAELNTEKGKETMYFLNSPKGRAAIRAIQSGRWRPTGEQPALTDLGEERPNIFQLYEENLGPLTPLLADALGEAEDTYPAVWIEDAIRIAVEKNKRNWRYVSAILERWQREGRDARKEKYQDRRDAPDPRQYVEGEFSDFIEH